jgi:hypothetical protein
MSQITLADKPAMIAEALALMIPGNAIKQRNGTA